MCHYASMHIQLWYKPLHISVEQLAIQLASLQVG